MQIKILKDTNEEEVNEALLSLQQEGNKILDIEYHPVTRHIDTTVVIKYTNASETLL